MVDSGYVTPTSNLVLAGTPARVLRRNLGTVADGYPGRLAVREDTDYDVKVSDGILPPLGWIGYEQAAMISRPETNATIYEVDQEVPILSGGGFSIYMPNGLAVGSKAIQGDPLLSWSAGKVVAGAQFGGRYAVKIPFSKSTEEVDTGIDLPAGCVVKDVLVQVDTNASGASIDVGMLSSEASGNAAGFLDGESLASAGFVMHGLVDGTAANNTLGELLVESDIKSADASALYYSVPVGYVCDGTTVSVSYTTSNHTVAGYIYLFVESPGIVPVGRAGAGADASSATTGVFVETTL